MKCLAISCWMRPPTRRAEEDLRAAFDLITDPIVRDAVARFVDASRDLGDAMTEFGAAGCKQVCVTFNDCVKPGSLRKK
jgi:hypothetical protein